MRKMGIWFLLVALFAGSSFALCEGEPSAAFSAPQPGDVFTLEKDMGLLIGESWFAILNDVAPLVSALGEPLEVVSAPSCVYKGEDREYLYDGMSLFTNPLGEIDIWYEAYITGGAYRTSRGIGIGSTTEDVLLAYGDGFYRESDTGMTYSVSGIEGDYASPCLLFEFSEGLVVSIDVYYPTNVS